MMGSEYVRRFGERGRGKPAGTIDVLPGLGTAQERAQAKRRAIAVMIDKNKEIFRDLYKAELKALAK